MVASSTLSNLTSGTSHRWFISHFVSSVWDPLFCFFACLIILLLKIGYFWKYILATLASDPIWGLLCPYLFCDWLKCFNEVYFFHSMKLIIPLLRGYSFRYKNIVILGWQQFYEVSIFSWSLLGCLPLLMLESG